MSTTTGATGSTGATGPTLSVSSETANLSLTPDMYGVFIGIFALVLSIVVLLTTGSFVAVLVLWLTIALILAVLVYYDIIDINPKQKVAAPVKPGPQATEPTVGGERVGNEVFHIADAQFVYDEAAAVCAAYDAKLATLEQVIDAFNNGAEWCSYGWSAGGMALYPTQKSTWDELQQEVDPGKRTRCGRPGVNGGYFDPSNKFGVNCWGFKPKGNVKLPVPAPGTDNEVFKRMVNNFKSMMKSMTMNPFSRTEWSMHAPPTVTKENYGNQFESLDEGFDNPYEEHVGNGVNYAPYGLLGATGPEGPQGPASTIPGPEGPEGPQGPEGPRGERGEKGDPGAAAAKGDPGPPGKVGPTGAPGKDGRDGKDGAPGKDGRDGKNGLDGPVGPQGPKGDPFGLPESWFEQKARSGAFKNYPKCVSDGESKSMAVRYALPGDNSTQDNTRFQLCAPYFNKGYPDGGGAAAAADNREDRRQQYRS